MPTPTITPRTPPGTLEDGLPAASSGRRLRPRRQHRQANGPTKFLQPLTIGNRGRGDFPPRPTRLLLSTGIPQKIHTRSSLPHREGLPVHRLSTGFVWTGELKVIGRPRVRLLPIPNGTGGRAPEPPSGPGGPRQLPAPLVQDYARTVPTCLLELTRDAARQEGGGEIQEQG
jgi:hypothetical protein